MENSERCYNCRNPQRYYTRGVKSYLQTDFGYCCECRAVAEVHHSCEKFVRRLNRTADCASRILSAFLSVLAQNVVCVRI